MIKKAEPIMDEVCPQKYYFEDDILAERKSIREKISDWSKRIYEGKEDQAHILREMGMVEEELSEDDR